jgi:hypothetical protein
MLNLAVLDDKGKEFKKFCNSLRCIRCGAQLDGNIHPSSANLYCCINNEEYKCTYIPNQSTPEYEQINIYYYPYRYMVETKSYREDGEKLFITEVSKINLELRLIYQHSERDILFTVNARFISLFKKQLSKEEFLNQLRIYLMFK